MDYVIISLLLLPTFAVFMYCKWLHQPLFCLPPVSVTSSIYSIARHCLTLCLYIQAAEMDLVMKGSLGGCDKGRKRLPTSPDYRHSPFFHHSLVNGEEGWHRASLTDAYQIRQPQSNPKQTFLYLFQPKPCCSYVGMSAQLEEG